MNDPNTNILSRFPFENAQMVSDLLYYDEPILSHYKFKNINFLKYLVDFDDDRLRYLNFQIDEYNLYRLISGIDNLNQVLFDSANFYTFLYLSDVEMISGNNIQTFQITIDELNSLYIPAKNSYVDNRFAKLPQYENLVNKFFETAYLEKLVENAFYLKFEPTASTYDGSLGIIELSKLLNLVTTSYKNFTKIDFFKHFGNQITDSRKLARLYNSILSYIDPRTVQYKFGSFEVGVAIDHTMKNNIDNKEIKNWVNEVEGKFKKSVLELDYSNEEEVDLLIEKEGYTQKEIESIFKPILKISQDSDYTFEYKDSDVARYTEIVVKKVSIINKLSPIPLKKVMEEEKDEEIEYLNIIVPKVVGKELSTSKIKLENTLFNQVNMYKLTNENFAEYGYHFDFEISIEVQLSSDGGKAVLIAVFENETFKYMSDNDNLKASLKKIIDKIAEYLYEKPKNK